MRQTVNISVNDIQNVNQALLVLKHFINLSSRLLPLLADLQQIEQPTEKEEIDKQRIIDVYKNYRFSTETSEILIGSNILQLIKESFQSLSNVQSGSDKKEYDQALKRFITEQRRLRNKWKATLAN
ncbi:MAG: hypothetical protein CSA03_00625 [Bacteroidetes bacterium]|nr:MAG: hypothetical protein CSA03_00625 [Bacteroidota bacterium]